jgi:hypothetical protein
VAYWWCKNSLVLLLKCGRAGGFFKPKITGEKPPPRLSQNDAADHIRANASICRKRLLMSAFICIL